MLQMPSTLTYQDRQDDFEFRLAQWILDQLKSWKELEAVIQQFNLLVTRTQEQSLADLYVHIAGLMLKRVTLAQREDSENDICLCAELCYHLLAIHFEQRSVHPLRVVFIHEHLFSLCIDSIAAEDIIQPAKTGNDNEPGTRLDITTPSSSNKISIENSSELLFHLFKFQLISLAQISEYIFRVTSSHGKLVSACIGNAVVGIRLLVELFPRCPGPWQKEGNLFSRRINMHSILDENKAKDDASQGEIPDDIMAKDQNTRGTGSPPFSDYNRTVQCQAHEEEVDEAEENNTGKPPRTPSTSRAESPVEACSEIAASTDQTTSFVDASISPPENLNNFKDTVNGAMLSCTTTPNVNINLLPSVISPLFGLASESNPSPAQSYSPPSTPPGLFVAPSHASLPMATTPLPASQALSPSSNNNAPKFSPNDSHNSANYVQIDRASEETSTAEGQVLASEERKQGEEAERKAEESRVAPETEREAKKRMAMEAWEEAEHKAKVDRMREGIERMAKREAEIKAKREQERKEQERMEMEQKMQEKEERKARGYKIFQEMEQLAKKEAELEATKQAEHNAKVDKMPEYIRRMPRREAQIKQEEEERKELEQRAREEEKLRRLEKKAKRKAERQAKKETKRKAQEILRTETAPDFYAEAENSSVKPNQNKASNLSVSLANSAWAKGPPHSSGTSRLQSLSNTLNTSTSSSQQPRQSALGLGTPPEMKKTLKGIGASTAHGSMSTTFGSIQVALAPGKRAETATALGTTSLSIKPKKINVHALFQGGGMPSVATTPPIAASTPSVVASLAPPPRGQASGFNDRNNPVEFPRSPQISGPTLPGPGTSDGQRPGSPRMLANVPLQYTHEHPMVHLQHRHTPYPGHTMQPPPPQWGPAGYYYPHNYNPYMYWGGHPQHQLPAPSSPRLPTTLPRPPSTPPVPNNASPHPSPINTSLQAPPSAPSPSSTVIPQPFVPGNLRIVCTPGDAVTFDSQIPGSPKVTTPIPPKRQSVAVRMETEKQKNERVGQGAGRKGPGNQRKGREGDKGEGEYLREEATKEKAG